MCVCIYYLGYVDFGLVSRVPVNVREGLICAVAQLRFARDTAKVYMYICIYYASLSVVVLSMSVYLSIYTSFRLWSRLACSGERSRRPHLCRCTIAICTRHGEGIYVHLYILFISNLCGLSMSVYLSIYTSISIH